LRVSERTASSDASDTENDADDNTNYGSSGENSGNSNDRNSTAIRIARDASTVGAEEELALILTSVTAVHWDAETTTEGVANIVGAQVVVSASDVCVHATKNAIADIVGADALIIAEISRNRSVSATRSNIALINSASITIVASTSNILPPAS
jgi:hypothetical protein